MNDPVLSMNIRSSIKSYLGTIRYFTSPLSAVRLQHPTPVPSGVQGVGSEGWAGFITTALAPNLGKIAPLQGWDGLNLFLLVCAATARGLFSDLAGGSGIFSFVNNNYRNYRKEAVKHRSNTIR